MQNELNTSLIEAVKEKLPLKENLANLLIDTLYIGKEAIYRRLRGEVPFTLEEAALISRKVDPFETYYSLLKKYVNVLHALQNDPSSSMGTSSNIIPQTLSLKHKSLSKFRLFKWMYQNKHIQCKHFDKVEVPQKIYDIQNDFVSATGHIHSVDYIWDSMIFHHLINDIQYFAGIHLITEEDKHQIKEELLQLTDELEDLASKGKTEAGNSVHIYVSHINFEATYSYLEADSVQLSLIRVYSINSITTQDCGMFLSLKEWIQSLKKFSTMISESGEMQRIQFFQQQREIISTL